MPDSVQHSILTQAVIDLLTPHFQLPDNASQALIEEDCCYPDDFFSLNKISLTELESFKFPLGGSGGPFFRDLLRLQIYCILA
jgi:hypothetical protein